MANTTAVGDTGEGFETGGEHNRFWRYWRRIRNGWRAQPLLEILAKAAVAAGEHW